MKKILTLSPTSILLKCLSFIESAIYFLEYLVTVPAAKMKGSLVLHSGSITNNPSKTSPARENAIN